MARVNRRDFLKKSVAAGVAVGVGSSTGAAVQVKRSASDWVELGKSGIKVTRLAFGTGTIGGRIQRELGQEKFTALVRHAYDRGIRFFESADSYGEMHERLAVALKGIPRDSYKLMTKIRWRSDEDPQAALDRFRRELNSEYFDILLMHCLRHSGWAEDLRSLQDQLSEAKEKQIVLAHGASCHGLLPLREFPGNQWLDVALLRVNHNGTLMDSVRGDSRKVGDVAEVVSHIERIHAQGTGVIGMKLVGEGRFTSHADRDASLKFVMGLGTVDAVTIGFKSTAEIDEAIDTINLHLNS
jgi:aryl-alcohol dehydrogenase-like predicted oxidoreductase